MFETLFSFFYLKAPRTVSSAISLGLSLDFFPVSFFFSSLGELTRVEETYPQYPECTCQRVSSIKLFSYRNNSGFRGGGLGLKVKSTKQKICVERRVVLIFVWSGFVVCCSNKVRTILTMDCTSVSSLIQRFGVCKCCLLSCPWKSAFLVLFNNRVTGKGGCV